MIAAVLVTEAEQTERAVMALIVLLLVVAALLTMLTIWYWVHTSPKRRERQARAMQQHVDLRADHFDHGAGPAEPQHLVAAPHVETRPRNLR